MSSRRFHGRGLFYAAIPVLAGAYSAYEVATNQLERQHAINWMTIFVPRLGFAFVLALLVYGLFRAAGSLVGAAPWRCGSGSTHLAVHHVETVGGRSMNTATAVSGPQSRRNSRCTRQ
jgi:hypothetical protein